MCEPRLFSDQRPILRKHYIFRRIRVDKPWVREFMALIWPQKSGRFGLKP